MPRVGRDPAPTSRPAPAGLRPRAIIAFMYHHEFPITPSQSAVNGALDMFVAGQRRDDPKEALVGLSVLRSATEPQIYAAMTVVGANRSLSRVEIEAMLAA